MLRLSFSPQHNLVIDQLRPGWSIGSIESLLHSFRRWRPTLEIERTRAYYERLIIELTEQIDLNNLHYMFVLRLKNADSFRHFDWRLYYIHILCEFFFLFLFRFSWVNADSSIIKLGRYCGRWKWGQPERDNSEINALITIFPKRVYSLL